MPYNRHMIKGKTQADVSAVMGCSQPQVSRWLSGRQKPRLDSLIQLAECLGMDPVELSKLLSLRRSLAKSIQE